MFAKKILSTVLNHLQSIEIEVAFSLEVIEQTERYLRTDGQSLEFIFFSITRGVDLNISGQKKINYKQIR